MIILDTNVFSEAIRPLAEASVQSWLDAQAAESLFLTSVTVAELSFGLEVLPEGRRKAALSKVVNGALELFEGRILAFDETAAMHYGALAAKARAAGRGFPTPDGYIAAIANAYGFSVASRDVSAFQAAGLNVINPWG